MASLRVRLEFPDVEKYWLFINLDKVKTIQDVIDDIDYKYSVTCEKLLLDDAQLYCKETVGILQDRDLIRVNLKTSTKRKKATEDNQKSSSQEPAEEVEKSSLSKPKKKKKCKEDGVFEHENLRRQMMEECEKVKNSLVVEKETIVVEKQRRVKKHRTEPEMEVEVIEHATESNITDFTATELTATQLNATQLNATELNTTDKEPSMEGGAKRKRRRKRKSHHKPEAVDSSLIQSFDAQQDYLPPAPKERQHLRFDGHSKDDTEPEICPADTATTGFGNHMKNESNCINRANHSYSEDAKMAEPKKFAKPFIHQSPSATSSPVVPQLGALLSLRSAVFSRNSYEKSTPPSYNSVPPPQSPASSEVVPSSPRVSASLPVKTPRKLDPTTFPIIKGLPRVNDLIAFKVLELSENYNPELSDYMQGRITHMSPASDITVQLVDPKPKRHSRGKFELIELDEEEFEEEPEIEYESTVTYQWNEMIEPRLIFP